jgi:hypothetical protein
MTDYRERHGTPEFTYWTNATKPQEAPPMPRMDLRCATTIAGCKTIAQILPAAWDQHQADQPRIRAIQEKAPSEANLAEAICK